MSAPPSPKRRPAAPAGPTAERTEHGGVRVTIPTMKLVSEANTRGHTFAKAGRVAAARGSTTAVLRVMAGPVIAPPCRVVITRVFSCQLDSDNLTGSAKHVRDGVADWMGVDDRDPRVEWLVAQEKGPAAVRIEVTPVVPWSLAAVSARVALEGPESVAELTLDPPRLRALAAQLLALADGGRAAPVTYAPKGSLTRLRFHPLQHQHNPQETAADAR